MDIPGRLELQKVYEELADEVLVEIAQNDDLEYENVAVEAARIVLEGRGVAIPVSHKGQREEDDGNVDSPEGTGISLESLKWFGEKLPGPLFEIPRFTAEESSDIEKLLTEKNIPYEKRAVMVAAGPEGGYREYFFYVQRETFQSTVQLLKGYFLGVVEEASSSYFSGDCPACGMKLVNVEKCTDCGLTLGGDYSESLGNHPFFLFLKQNHLLS